MNYYFLLEDEKSFIKVLPKWLQYLGIPNKRVVDIADVTDNCYVMQSGHGVTQLITKALYQTLDTIISYNGKIDELIIILDSEEYDVEHRKNEIELRINEYIQEKNTTLDFSYKVFVCNHCFETWLLGNRKLYPDTEPTNNNFFLQYYRNYNVKQNNPEELRPPLSANETISAYHFHYFHEMCRYNKIRYSKKNPHNVSNKSFFNELVKRISETSHLQSFNEFYNYFSHKK